MLNALSTSEQKKETFSKWLSPMGSIRRLVSRRMRIAAIVKDKVESCTRANAVGQPTVSDLWKGQLLQGLKGDYLLLKFSNKYLSQDFDDAEEGGENRSN